MINREQLDEIIMKNDTNDWWQPDLFVKNTKHLLPPELEILIDPLEESKNYNCFIYAFGLHNDTTILKETNGFIYDSFAKKLIEAGELVRTEEPIGGDYVVYQDLENYPDSLTHIGVLSGDKVFSKWAWGPLIKHDVWDVPKEYGGTVFYLKAIPEERTVKLYERYKSFNTKPE